MLEVKSGAKFVQHFHNFTTREAAMARLFRFIKLNDRFDTQIFTFILPHTLVKEFSPDVYSRDFVYGHQKWSISLEKTDKHVGSFLTLKNVSDGMVCIVDFSFTLLNSEHFTKNESFAERNCVFTNDRITNGRRTFIGLGDLCSRGFMHETGEYLLELELRNITTTFEQVLQLPKGAKDHSNDYEYSKFETNYFTFGNFDWNLSIYPFGDRLENDGRPLVFLTRQTNFDHLCRVRYRLMLGHGDRILDSDTLEQMFDISGNSPPYDVSYNLYNLTSSKARMKVKAELLSVTAVSEIQLSPLNRSKNRTHLYDRDKQAWMIETDLSTEYLKFRLYYVDVRNVPRRFVRYVCWSLMVMPARGQVRPVKALRAPFFNYYSQSDLTEEGFEIDTDIHVNEINDPESVFLDESTHRLTIQLEWIDSHLLYNDRFQRLDDVNSKQKHQMMRELLALQAENLSLEKQLHSYQVSISKNHARRRYSESVNDDTPYSSPSH